MTVTVLLLAAVERGSADHQPAYCADLFTDFVGINASPFERYLDSGPYAGAGTKYSLDVFLDLGIRHYRTGLFHDLVEPDSPARMKRLWEEHGAQPLLLIDPHKTKTAAAVLQKLSAFDPRLIGGIEGPNEVNNKFPPQELNLRYGGRTDEAAGAFFMSDVFAALNADESLKDIPVVAFTAIFTDYRLARPHEGFDFGNMHSYQGYDVPSSSLLANETRSNRLLPDGAMIRPYVPTECGYNVQPDVANGTHGTGSLRAQALNIPMLFAEYFRHGIRRTYFFALHNADGYGLLESDQKTKRPSYFAVKSLLAIIKDSSWNPKTLSWESAGSFVPRALLFSMHGAPPSVHSLTLQKANGDHLLLLWNEVPNFDQGTKTDTSPAPVPVTLSFANAMDPHADIHVQDKTGAFLASQSRLVDDRLDLEIPSSVVILKLRVAGSAASSRCAAPQKVVGEADGNIVRLKWEPASNSETAGFFVFRNGGHIATTEAATFEDASEWIRPGLGYRYEVQAYRRDGTTSLPVEVVVRTPSKFPDLVISKLEAPAVDEGKPVRFGVDITNAGDGPTPNNVVVAATFRVDGKVVSWGGHHAGPLQPGQTVHLVGEGGPGGTSEWTATSGAHLLSVELDDVNRIPEERNKSNNFADRGLLVGVEGEGLLIGSSDVAPFEVDLTSEGTLDWIHWGLGDKAGVNRKATGENVFSDLTFFGEGHVDATPGFGMRVKWSDGKTTASQPATNASLWLNGVGHGYEFSVPANKEEQVLKVYVGGIEGAQGKLTARLSDGSAPEYVSTTWNANAAFDWAPVPGAFTAMYTLRYRAASPGQKLIVKWVLDREPNRFLGQARIQAATLAKP